MAPPSQLSIATSALHRLIKEEGSYHKELQEQQDRLQKLQDEDGDENKDFLLKQQKKAIEETNALFPALRQRIMNAMNKLEKQLEEAKDAENNSDEITKAKETIAEAKKAYRDAM